MKVPAGIGFYFSTEGRARYLELYDQVAGLGPPPLECLDVPTGFGVVRVYRHGQKQGPPVVLLPGAFATAVSWGPNIAGLATQHSVYSVDVLGQPGLSVQEAMLM